MNKILRYFLLQILVLMNTTIAPITKTANHLGTLSLAFARGDTGERTTNAYCRTRVRQARTTATKTLYVKEDPMEPMFANASQTLSETEKFA